MATRFWKIITTTRFHTSRTYRKRDQGVSHLTLVLISVVLTTARTWQAGQFG
jgi:hypothetical protein